MHSGGGLVGRRLAAPSSAGCPGTINLSNLFCLSCDEMAYMQLASQPNAFKPSVQRWQWRQDGVHFLPYPVAVLRQNPACSPQQPSGAQQHPRSRLRLMTDKRRSKGVQFRW